MSANTAGQQDDRLYPLPAPSPQPDVDVRSSASAVSGAKLNQVVQVCSPIASHRVTRTSADTIQSFFCKAAQIVVQSRQNVAPLLVKGTQTKKLNKWVSLRRTSIAISDLEHDADHTTVQHRLAGHRHVPR